MHSDALDVRAVFVRRPDVAEVRERDAALMIMWVTHEPRFTSEREAGHGEEKRDGEQMKSFHVREPL